MADCLTVSVESSFDDRGMALAGAVMAEALTEVCATRECVMCVFVRECVRALETLCAK